MKQIRLLTLLALLLTAATGAWADETLLLTIENKNYEDFKSGSMTFDNKVTVTFSSSVLNDGDYYGWYTNSPSLLTVAGTNDYTITSCKFYTNDGIASTGYTVEGESPSVYLNEYNVYTDDSKSVYIGYSGITKIEVYGAAASAAGYTVSLKDGVKDADKWTVKVGEGQAQALPIGGLKGDGSETVTLQYNGRLKVKSVKAVKKGGAEPVDNTYLKWDADQKKLVATDIQAEVTTVQNANTDVEWTAGTYVVEGEVTISGSIALNGNVDLIIKDGAKLTVNNYILGYASYNLSIFGQSNQTGELVVNSSLDAIEDIKTLEVHSAKVKATSSGNNNDGFYNIQTFNVYGGTVDAESTGTNGNGILLASSGKMKIYGGDVKALGKGNKFGIAGNHTTVTVHGGKLWAGCFNNKAIDASNVTLEKGAGFTGKIEISGNGESWSDWEPSSTPGTNYVRVGY